jgi:hypothetical protein
LRITRGPGHQREILEDEGTLGAGPLHFAAVDEDLAAAAGMSPAMIFRSVVLPQPEGPRSVVS